MSLKSFFLGQEGKPEEFVDITPTEFQATRAGTAAGLKDLLASGGGDPFAGPLAAGITADEQSLVNLATQQAGDTPLSRAATSTVGQTAEGGFLQGGPLLDEALQTVRAPTQATIRGIAGGPVDASGRPVTGPVTDPFGRASQIAEQGLQNALTDVEQTMRAHSFAKETERQQNAIKLAGDVASGGLKKTIAGLQAAALPRIIEDLGIERGLAEFNSRIQRLLETINTGVQIGAAAPVKFGAIEGTPGSIRSALKGAAGFAQSGGSFGGGGGAGGAAGAAGG